MIAADLRSINAMLIQMSPGFQIESSADKFYKGALIEESVETLIIEREKQKRIIAELREQLDVAQAFLANARSGVVEDDRPSFAARLTDMSDLTEDADDSEVSMLKIEVEELRKKLSSQHEQLETYDWLQMQLDRQTTRADELKRECDWLRHKVESDGIAGELEEECARLRQGLRHKGESDDIASELEEECARLRQEVEREQRSQQRLSDEVERLENRVRELEHELERERASRKIELEERSKAHAEQLHEAVQQVALLHLQLDETSMGSTPEIDELRNECSRLQGQLDEMADVHSVQSAKFQRERESQADIIETLRCNHTALKLQSHAITAQRAKEIEVLKSECAQLREQLSARLDSEQNLHQHDEASHIAVEVDVLRKTCAHLQERLDLEVRNHALKIDEAERERASLKQQLDETLKVHSLKVEDMQRDLSALQVQRNEAVAKQTAEMTAVKQENANLKTQLDEFSRMYSEQLEALEEIDAVARDLTHELEVLQKANDELQRANDQLQKSRDADADAARKQQELALENKQKRSQKADSCKVGRTRSLMERRRSFTGRHEYRAVLSFVE
eukprot:TRINITY_DN14687_c0_g3_i1.p1 TRINITY_DN14687_c0_g3~~TRINITY_DN14687_c0_g3_i1.p1  ORF type:complete len:569 (-),score=107.32 TRINITY_DN14687_c0_g3_i1:574-2280(-)